MRKTKKSKRRRHEPKPSADRRKRETDRYDDNRNRHRDEEPVWPAREEPAPRSDGEDHQHLGRHRLHKPAGMKKRLAGVKHMQESVEGEKIEDRADRPEDQHEMLDKLNVPFHWRGDGFLVNLIER